jgi:hypothetical protein
MSVVRRTVTVDAPASDLRGDWAHFLDHVMTAREKVVCDALVCVDAVDKGVVSLEPTKLGTLVTFAVDTPDELEAPGPDEIGQRLMHDLLVFKDYVERAKKDRKNPSTTAGKPTEASYKRP